MGKSNLEKLVIGTRNPHKAEEITKVLEDLEIPLLLLPDSEDIPVPDESGISLFANALRKARAYYEVTGIPTIADDTGLYVKALPGEPGIRSARYAGENATDEENRKKLLERMKGIEDREATFQTVVCFFYAKDQWFFFKGNVIGEILTEEKGTGGFGYDPIFYLPQLEKTFAELTLEEKIIWSHRSNALRKFKKFLEKGFPKKR